MSPVPALDAARAALSGGTIELVSPPFAACHAGVNFYAALVKQLRNEFPEHPFRFTLCCGDDPAIAHDALRMGFTSVICATSAGMRAQLQTAADRMGAQVLAAYPNA